MKRSGALLLSSDQTLHQDLYRLGVSASLPSNSDRSCIILDSYTLSGSQYKLLRQMAVESPNLPILITRDRRPGLRVFFKKHCERIGFTHVQYVDDTQLINTLEALQEKCTHRIDDIFSVPLTLDQLLQYRKIICHYQPKYNLLTGRLSGFEALARLDDPVLGQIGPSGIIEQIEITGLASAFFQKVLQQSFQDMSAMTSYLGDSVNLAVNMTPSVMADNNLITVLDNLAAHYCFPLHLLTLELTERTPECFDPIVQRNVVALKDRGVRLSIDDFGVGFSGLSKLVLGYYDEVKIDQQFIREIASCRTSHSIVESVIKLAHDAGLSVVAEGVELEATEVLLKRLKCDLVQGFHYGKPAALEQYRPHL